MSFVVSSIVEVSMDKNNILNSVCVDDFYSRMSNHCPWYSMLVYTAFVLFFANGLNICQNICTDEDRQVDIT